MDVYDFSSSVLSENVLFCWQFLQRPRGDHVLTINSLHKLGGTYKVRAEIYIIYIVLCLFLCVILIYILSVEKPRLGSAAPSFSLQKRKSG